MARSSFYKITTGIVSSVSRAHGNTPANPYPTPTNQDHLIAYAPSWGHGSNIDNANSKFRKLPDYVGTVLLSFVRPTITMFNSGNSSEINSGKDWSSDFGLDFGPSITPAQVKSDIDFMRLQGKTVYVSVGGATFTSDLPALEAEGELIYNGATISSGTTPHCYNLKQFCSYFGVHLDADWEDLAVSPNTTDHAYRMHMFHVALYEVEKSVWGADNQLATASFSTAWATSSLFPADPLIIPATTTRSCQWGGNAGQSRMAVRYTNNGTQYGTGTHRGGEYDYLAMLKLITIMSYDIGSELAPSGATWGSSDYYYAPQAYSECIDVITRAGFDSTIRVAMGIEIPPEGAGKATMMVDTAHCTQHESVMYTDYYDRFNDGISNQEYHFSDGGISPEVDPLGPIGYPHSAEMYGNVINAARASGYNTTDSSTQVEARPQDTIMIWSMWKGNYMGNNADGHPYATPNTACDKIAGILGLPARGAGESID